MSWRTNRRSKNRFKLHPFVEKPSETEPILVTSQKLTPAQKEHLAEFQDRDSLFSHLAAFHGLIFPTGREKGLDPQVRERFDIAEEPFTTIETLRLRHLQEHLENIAEREITK